jgi:hypothetical protein
MSVKVNDKVWRDLKAKVGKLADATVKVGVLGSDVTDEGFQMASLAAVHEFGSARRWFGLIAGHIPERSFIRRTLREKRDGIGTMTGKLARGIIADRFDVKTALEMLGLQVATDVKKTITEGEGVPPPNAPATIEKKESSRPLVDTGRLVQSITHEVEGA